MVWSQSLHWSVTSFGLFCELTPLHCAHCAKSPLTLRTVSNDTAIYHLQVARMPRLRQKCSLAVVGILGGCASVCVPSSLLCSLSCSLATVSLKASLGCRREERGERRDAREGRREERVLRREDKGNRGLLPSPSLPFPTRVHKPIMNQQ